MSQEIECYKFSEFSNQNSPEDILGGRTPEEFLKDLYINRYHFGLDNVRSSAMYKLHGWAYIFRPYLKRYVVRQYDSWFDYYAPNKTLLRKSLYGKLDKIVEFK
jgi:hypothetical protein